METIFVTGGAGFIGSHTVVSLLNQNYKVIILDNFSNSSKDVLSNITKITNKDFTCYEGDIRNERLLDYIFKNEKIDAVIHFAGKKSIDESLRNPTLYYSNNVAGSITLIDKMVQYHIQKLIFSSSATVYGKQEVMPIKEDAPLMPQTNPYGKSKRIVEEVLEDVAATLPYMKITVLRYFNPIGAHQSGLIGEIPRGVPNNLVPYITGVLVGKYPFLKIYGNDYPTPDGTGIRDFIHVSDLAASHVLALKSQKNFDIFNVGTGTGHSVLEILSCFEDVTGKKIPFKFFPRRIGDIDTCYADISKIKSSLGFFPEKSLRDCCFDQWMFQLHLNK